MIIQGENVSNDSPSPMVAQFDNNNSQSLYGNFSIPISWILNIGSVYHITSDLGYLGSIVPYPRNKSIF